MVHLLLVAMVALLPLLSWCPSSREHTSNGATIVFKQGKIAGDPAKFRNLLDRFERENPGIKVKDETLPASTDERHQYYVINLEGKSADFDLLGMDVIWAQEFARAGWLSEVSYLTERRSADELQQNARGGASDRDGSVTVCRS